MEYGYEIKFWDRPLTNEEIINEYLSNISDGELDFSKPEPSTEPENFFFINSSNLGENIIIQASSDNNITESTPEPATESTPESATESTPESATESTPEPATESATDSGSNSY